MAIYLKEHEIGTDASLIGFPTLGGCMGMVIQTSTTMYGFHNPPGNNYKAPTFATLYSGQSAICLYSCARWKERYANASRDGRPEFEARLAEIRELAGILNYTGPVVGVNLSGLLSITDPRESAYCEYRRSGSGAVSVAYSLTSNTTASDAVDLNTHVRRITNTNTTSVPYLSKVIVNMSSTDMRTPATSGKDEGKGIYAFTLS